MDELTVPIDLPPAPHVLASQSFLATLTVVEEEVDKLEVNSAETATIAAQLQGRLTRAGKGLEQARTTLKAPFIAAGRAIDAAAKDPQARINASKAIIKSGLESYASEQRAKAAEVERLRQVELDRLEKIRMEEEATENKRQDELAAQVTNAGAVDLGFEDDEPAEKTATEKEIEAVKHAPIVAQSAPAGIAYRTSLYPHIEDINKLPDLFVTKTAKIREIRSTFCTGYKEGDPIPELAGVRFEIRKDAVSTGREQF